MMQVLYFYTSHTARLRLTQVDRLSMLTEQQLISTFGPGGSGWKDGRKWTGIEVSESDAKPLNAGTTQQVQLYSVPQCSTEQAKATFDQLWDQFPELREHVRQRDSDLLKTAVRALECIHRFTSDTYARSALAEIEQAGWPVDWEGRKGEMCNIGGCTKAAEKGRYQCREHDK